MATVEQNLRRSARHRERYLNDPEYRQKFLDRNRKYRQEHPKPRKRQPLTPEEREAKVRAYRRRPDVKERVREAVRLRYRTDPEYRERKKTISLRRYYALKEKQKQNEE